jgi:hypothetical protein
VQPDQRHKIRLAAQSQALSLVDCSFQCPSRQDPGEIENRPGRAGDGNAPSNRHLGGLQGGEPMHHEFGPRSTTLTKRNGDVNPPTAMTILPRCPDLPQISSCPVTEHGVLAGRQHRCHPSAFARQVSKPDRVDPSMDGMKPTHPGAALDLGLGKTE